MTLIERLRKFGDDLSGERFTVREASLGAADLLESQAARIAELEAENERLHRMGEAQMLARHNSNANEEKMFHALQDLRRKIDEAPEVGWVAGKGSLISKEDTK